MILRRLHLRLMNSRCTYTSGSLVADIVVDLVGSAVSVGGTVDFSGNAVFVSDIVDFLGTTVCAGDIVLVSEVSSSWAVV